MSNFGKSVAPSKKRTVWERDKVCHYCDAEPEQADRSVDHIWPRALGGANANWNLVAACKPCNSSLGNRTDKCDCEFCAEAKRLHKGMPTQLEPGGYKIADLLPAAIVRDLANTT